MINPQTNGMTLKEAIKIIKAVKKLGVKRLKLGTLEFEFAENETRVVRPTFKVSEKEIARDTEQNTVQANFSDARDALSIMHVEDPLGFESAIIERELEGSDDVEVVDSSGDTIEETYSQ